MSGTEFLLGLSLVVANAKGVHTMPLDVFLQRVARSSHPERDEFTEAAGEATGPDEVRVLIEGPEGGQFVMPSP